MKKILFVCTGNTCRSPMAAVLFNTVLQGQALPQKDYTAESAGLHAYEGDPASTHAERVMREMGSDLSQHRARRISKALLEDAFLVLTMTGEQKEHLIALHPGMLEKVFTLREFAAEDKKIRYYMATEEDIQDPYGGMLEDYRECAREIEGLVRQLIERLKSF